MMNYIIIYFVLGLVTFIVGQLIQIMYLIYAEKKYGEDIVIEIVDEGLFEIALSNNILYKICNRMGWSAWILLTLTIVLWQFTFVTSWYVGMDILDRVKTLYNKRLEELNDC